MRHGRLHIGPWPVIACLFFMTCLRWSERWSFFLFSVFTVVCRGALCAHMGQHHKTCHISYQILRRISSTLTLHGTKWATVVLVVDWSRCAADAVFGHCVFHQSVSTLYLSSLGYLGMAQMCLSSVHHDDMFFVRWKNINVNCYRSCLGAQMLLWLPVLFTAFWRWIENEHKLRFSLLILEMMFAL